MSTTLSKRLPFLAPRLNCLLCGVEGGNLNPVKINILSELLRLSPLTLPPGLTNSDSEYHIPVCPRCHNHVQYFTVLLTQLSTLVQEMERIRLAVAETICNSPNSAKQEPQVSSNSTGAPESELQLGELNSETTNSPESPPCNNETSTVESENESTNSNHETLLGQLLTIDPASLEEFLVSNVATQAQNDQRALLQTPVHQQEHNDGFKTVVQDESPKRSCPTRKIPMSAQLASPGSSNDAGFSGIDPKSVATAPADSPRDRDFHNFPLSPPSSTVHSPDPAAKPELVNCTRCKEPFTSKQKLSQHMQACLNVEVTSVTCEVCQEVIPTKHWIEHAKIHETWYKCKKCNAAYRQKLSLTKHIEELHPVLKRKPKGANNSPSRSNMK